MTAEDRKFITDQIDGVKKDLREVLNDKLNPVKETLVNYKQTLNEHYNRLLNADTERATLTAEITNMKLKTNDLEHDVKDMQKTVNGLDRRQSKDEGFVVGKDNERDAWLKKNGQNVAIAGLILTVIGLIIGIVLS